MRGGYGGTIGGGVGKEKHSHAFYYYFSKFPVIYSIILII